MSSSNVFFKQLSSRGKTGMSNEALEAVQNMKKEMNDLFSDNEVKKERLEHHRTSGAIPKVQRKLNKRKKLRVVHHKGLSSSEDDSTDDGSAAAHIVRRSALQVRVVLQ